MADETEKITYEVVIDASQATATGNKVADTFSNIEGASKKSASALKEHSDVVDKLVPGLNGMIGGIQSATKASLAFIATPLGAVIAALGVAIASVTAYFKSSEEAENKLMVVTKTLGAVFEQLTNFAEDLGEMIVGVFENPKQALIDFANLIKDNIVNRFIGMLELIPKLGQAVGLLFEGKFVEAGETAFNAIAKVTTGIEDASGKIEGFIKKVGEAVEEGITAGQRLANIQADIDKKQRQLIEERAKTDIAVIKLREEAIKQEGETRKQTIQNAIDLEVALSNKEVQLAKLKQEQAALEVKNNGDTKEALNKLAEANAAVTNAEATRYQNTLRFSKEIERLNNEQEAAEEKYHDEQIKRLQEEEKARKAALDDEVKNQQEVDGLFVKQEEERLQTEQHLADVRYANYKKAKEAEKKLDNEALAAKKANIAGQNAVLSQGTAFLHAAFGNSKEVAVAEALVNTYKGASQAIGAYPPPFGEILAALVVATGLANVAKITGIEFAEGGLSGTRIKAGMGRPIYRANGDNMVATVRTGEVILNERQQAALGGDRTFAAIGVPGFAGGGITDSQLTYSLNNNMVEQQLNSDRQLDKMVSKINSIQSVLVIEDVENMVNRRTQIRDTATI